MADIVVSLGEDADLELETVDVGVADDGGTVAFTIEGVLRGLEPDVLEKFAGESVVPTEIHFRIAGE